MKLVPSSRGASRNSRSDESLPAGRVRVQRQEGRSSRGGRCLAGHSLRRNSGLGRRIRVADLIAEPLLIHKHVVEPGAPSFPAFGKGGIKAQVAELLKAVG